MKASIIIEKDELPHRTRADCLNEPRPCFFLACKHHMIYLMAADRVRKLFWLSDDKIIKLVSGMPETCSLDIADRGPVTLNYVASIALKDFEGAHFTRQMISLIELSAIRKLKTRKLLNAMKYYAETVSSYESLNDELIRKFLAHDNWGLFDQIVDPF